MKNYWISWYHRPDYSDFELRSPWWISGTRLSDDAETICAAVRAESQDAAEALVVQSYDDPPFGLEWRFVDQMPDDWSPYGDRFGRADWMPDWPPPEVRA